MCCLFQVIAPGWQLSQDAYVNVLLKVKGMDYRTNKQSVGHISHAPRGSMTGHCIKALIDTQTPRSRSM